MPHNREIIQKAFGKNPARYDAKAKVQKKIADNLSAFLPMEATRILEIGCGTGFLTQHLADIYPQASILATDIAKGMVDFCAAKFSQTRLKFHIMDAEKPDVTGPFDLIVSSMAFQWLEDPVSALKHYKSLLSDGGAILYAVPGPDNFKEWRQAHQSLGFKNGLRDSHALPGVVHEGYIRKKYPSALHFLQEMKDVGAHIPHEDYASLDAGSLRKILRIIDTQHQSTITWHVLYGEIS